MKYPAIILVFISVMIEGISVAKASYIEDVQSLGYVSGEGLACGAKRYKSYELIARAFMVSSAKSDKEQTQGMYAYNSAKAEAYLSRKHSGLLGCDEIIQRFNKQKIFNTKVYKNGTLKMPDGKIIKPRQKYDPNLLYDKNSNEREKLNEYFDKLVSKNKEKAKNQGIYDKIRQIEMKNR